MRPAAVPMPSLPSSSHSAAMTSSRGWTRRRSVRSVWWTLLGVSEPTPQGPGACA
uniref:Alternative protein KIF1C n=1 Tax=Homo sapiens TaxID=9606 RepID=L0R5B7_HUMAN|nr:alternative protein KIF1C [Homo sapiens]